MRGEQYAELQNWFNGHVAAAYRQSPGLHAWVKLKDEHTRRVVDNITRIGRSLSLSTEDLLIARSTALLHDAGRFTQIELYGTFNDGRSENHATLGTRVLARAAVLKDIPPEEAHIIMTAIDMHNLRELPPALPARLCLYARLIQDADKLDIMALFTSLYTAENTGFATVLEDHLPDSPGYSAALIEDIMAGNLGNYKDVYNANDRKLLHLSWVYGIHFDYTLAEIERNGYVDKTAGVLPRTGDVGEIHRRVKSYVAGRVQNRS